MRIENMRIDNMRIKNIILIFLVSVSVLLAGCVNKDINKSTNITNTTNESVISIKYLEDNGKIISNPNYKLILRQKLIAPINLSNTIESESVHGGLIINSTEETPKGYRVYGYSETYYSNKSYALVQYKVFDNDNNNDLNNSIDLTVNQYVANGFITKRINKTDPIKFKGRVIILEANSTANVTNVPKDMSVDIILFGKDTLIGKIGVEDYKNKSLEESLDMLNEFSDKIKINTREEVSTNNFGIHQK